MEFLLEPNVAYLILLAGVLLTFLAIVTPGTGMLEVGALFCIALAGYAIYNLSFNGWALLVLVLSLVPFGYAIQKPKRELYLGLAILLLVVGSMFMFPTKTGLFAVNPLVAILASIMVAGFLWFAVRKSIQAADVTPTHNLDRVMGKVGEARTTVHEGGSVFVGGEMWSARSNNLIPAHSRIRVIGRDGIVVVVEQENHHSS